MIIFDYLCFNECILGFSVIFLESDIIVDLSFIMLFFNMLCVNDLFLGILFGDIILKELNSFFSFLDVIFFLKKIVNLR